MSAWGASWGRAWGNAWGSVGEQGPGGAPLTAIVRRELERRRRLEEIERINADTLALVAIVATQMQQ